MSSLLENLVTRRMLKLSETDYKASNKIEIHLEGTNAISYTVDYDESFTLEDLRQACMEYLDKKKDL